MDLERNKTLYNLNTNEYGDTGHIKVRFYKNKDCQNAYKNYMCWINFPRCDLSTDETLPTCRSACENYFISCGYEQKLWRCGKTKYFNGYFPEYPSSSTSGNTSYLREYFPGQPFRKNKFIKKTGEEIPICTPAVKGSGARINTSASKKILVIYFLLLSALIYFIIWKENKNYLKLLEYYQCYWKESNHNDIMVMRTLIINVINSLIVRDIVQPIQYFQHKHTDIVESLVYCLLLLHFCSEVY